MLTHYLSLSLLLHDFQITLNQSSGGAMVAGKTAQWESVGSFEEGLAQIRIGRKSGYIDRTGKIVIPVRFGSADSFKNGLAMISFEEMNTPYGETKWGYIDKTGKIIWQPTN